MRISRSSSSVNPVPASSATVCAIRSPAQSVLFFWMHVTRRGGWIARIVPPSGIAMTGWHNADPSTDTTSGALRKAGDKAVDAFRLGREDREAAPREGIRERLLVEQRPAPRRHRAG